MIGRQKSRISTDNPDPSYITLCRVGVASRDSQIASRDIHPGSENGLIVGGSGCSEGQDVTEPGNVDIGATCYTIVGSVDRAVLSTPDKDSTICTGKSARTSTSDDNLV